MNEIIKNPDFDSVNDWDSADSVSGSLYLIYRDYFLAWPHPRKTIKGMKYNWSHNFEEPIEFLVACDTEVGMPISFNPGAVPNR